jgi:hypothetical protein
LCDTGTHSISDFSNLTCDLEHPNCIILTWDYIEQIASAHVAICGAEIDQSDKVARELKLVTFSSHKALYNYLRNDISLICAQQIYFATSKTVQFGLLQSANDGKKNSLVRNDLKKYSF